MTNVTMIDDDEMSKDEIRHHNDAKALSMSVRFGAAASAVGVLAYDASTRGGVLGTAVMSGLSHPFNYLAGNPKIAISLIAAAGVTAAYKTRSLEARGSALCGTFFAAGALSYSDFAHFNMAETSAASIVGFIVLGAPKMVDAIEHSSFLQVVKGNVMGIGLGTVLTASVCGGVDHFFAKDEIQQEAQQEIQQEQQILTPTGKEFKGNCDGFVITKKPQKLPRGCRIG